MPDAQAGQTIEQVKPFAATNAATRRKRYRRKLTGGRYHD